MLDITLKEELRSKWDLIAIGSLEAEIVVKPSSQELITKLDDTCNQFALNHKVEEIAKLKPVQDSRKAYKSLGKDPARYRLSSEALLRRIVKEKGIYKINNIVEINNLISIESKYSICAFDISKLKPPCRKSLNAFFAHYVACRSLPAVKVLLAPRDNLQL